MPEFKSISDDLIVAIESEDIPKLTRILSYAVVYHSLPIHLLYDLVNHFIEISANTFSSLLKKCDEHDPTWSSSPFSDLLI